MLFFSQCELVSLSYRFENLLVFITKYFQNIFNLKTVIPIDEYNV